MTSTPTLATTHDALLLDLDGTVYEGGRPIAGVLEVLTATSLPMQFVTNNASRAPHKVAEQLQGIGYNATADDVMTSAQAAIELAAAHVPAGSAVLVLGTDSFKDLARAAGYAVVDSADDKPAAVFQGHNPNTGWAQLSEAALAIANGALYLASNLDTTLPMERGRYVGNGSMVAAVVSATGVEPISAGKPLPPMFFSAAAKLNSTSPLAVGDRLDTDIAGGVAANMDTYMVISGVSGHFDTLFAPPAHRPKYLGATMAGLTQPVSSVTPGPQGGFLAHRDGAAVVVSGDGSIASGEHAAANLLLTAAEVVWATNDDTNPNAITEIRASSVAAQAALDQWR